MLIKIVIAVCVISISFIFNTCSSDNASEPANHPPEIISLSANPDVVDPSGSVVLICEATDPDGDNLDYIWEAFSGSIGGSGDSVTWQAPDSIGNFLIICRVLDGKGGEDTDQVEVEVERQIPTDGLIAYWPFNGNANDESGNGHDGEVHGSTLTSDRFNIDNRAYFFDGINDYIYIGKSSFPPPFTVVAWIYKTGKKDTQTLLGSDYYIKIEQYRNTHKVGFTRKQVGDYTFNYEIPLNTWQCVAWVFDYEARLYVDGKYIDTNSHTISCPMTNISSGANIILGKVDDIRIYNRALTEAELEIIYHEGDWDL